MCLDIPVHLPTIKSVTLAKEEKTSRRALAVKLYMRYFALQKHNIWLFEPMHVCFHH